MMIGVSTPAFFCISADTSLSLLLSCGSLGITPMLPLSSRSLQLLGAQKKQPVGFSTSARVGNSRHTGFIFQSDVVQNTPAEYRMKAQRTVGAKCTLACRMDMQRAYTDGECGVPARFYTFRKMYSVDLACTNHPNRLTGLSRKPQPRPSLCPSTILFRLVRSETARGCGKETGKARGTPSTKGHQGAARADGGFQEAKGR